MFEESKHPRDENGRFTDTDNMSADELKEELQHELPEKKPVVKDAEKKMTPAEKKRKTQDEFFGEEFKGVKGMEAVEKLLKEKRGHVKNAFERPEIGGITLVWGDEKGGLSHAIQRRDEMFNQGFGNIRGEDIAKMIPDIIDQGEFSIDSKDRPRFELKGYRVAIKPSYFDEKLNWVVSAMEIKNPKEN